MVEQNSREGQLNAVIDPKLLFLAKVAARYRGETLIQFIERAFISVFANEPIFEDEPNVEEPKGPKSHIPKKLAALWDDDEAVRLWNAATAKWGTDLLTPKQRRVFNDISLDLIRRDKKVTKNNFIEAFNASEAAN